MYKEPKGQQIAGRVVNKVLPTPYEVFMNEQEIPIYRGMGVYDVRQLPVKPWKRMGGRGTFIELDGQAGMYGIYLVEIPAGGALNPERHVYEEIFLVIEGRGTTEVWLDDKPKKQAFEWQPGSHFSVPLNAWHRLINGTSRPALVLVAMSAPQMINLVRNKSFVFDNPFEFSDRYDQSDDYFKPREELEPDPLTGRALLRSSLLPDIANCYLPLDNQRAPGYRWIRPRMANNTFFGGFIAEYPSGSYSKGHFHESGAVLICLKGKGYTYTWPVGLGPRPWEAGKADQVKVQEYVAGGMVSAAPGGGDWFHQHFSTCKESFRVRAIIVALKRRPGEEAGDEVVIGNADIAKGGRTISYREEDPQIRKNYKEALEKEGVEMQMPESLFK